MNIHKIEMYGPEIGPYPAHNVEASLDINVSNLDQGSRKLFVTRLTEAFRMVQLAISEAMIEGEREVNER